MKSTTLLVELIDFSVPPVESLDGDGTRRFTVGGVLHRLDGPALEMTDGSTVWYREGALHRDGGPAYVVLGSFESWYYEGQMHRDGGPAFLSMIDGRLEWWVHGKQHRVGGPATEAGDGTEHYYLWGVHMSRAMWLREILYERVEGEKETSMLRSMSETWDGSPGELLATIRILVTDLR